MKPQLTLPERLTCLLEAVGIVAIGLIMAGMILMYWI